MLAPEISCPSLSLAVICVAAWGPLPTHSPRELSGAKGGLVGLFGIDCSSEGVSWVCDSSLGVTSRDLGCWSSAGFSSATSF